jgi:ATP-dependent protease HslVU (ClpYQ) ATPase subunit
MSEEALNDVLQGEETPDEPVETTEATGEDTAPPAEETQDKEVLAFKAKAQDEKRKRQEAQQQLQEMEARLKRLEEPETEIDYWEDPKKAIDSTVETRFNALEEQMTSRIWGLSEQLAKERHEDYQEITDYFVDHVAPKSPHLVEQAKLEPNPYEFIYQQAKAQKQLEEVGDVDKLRAQIRAEIEAELKGKPEVPPTLSNERAAGPTPSPDSDDLEDILGR